jgi:hypothetical protein
LPHVRGGRALDHIGLRGPPALFYPSFDLGKIPDHTSGGEIKASRKFTPLFHLVDRGVGYRYNLAQLRASDGSPEV